MSKTFNLKKCVPLSAESSSFHIFTWQVNYRAFLTPFIEQLLLILCFYHSTKTFSGIQLFFQTSDFLCLLSKTFIYTSHHKVFHEVSLSVFLESLTQAVKQRPNFKHLSFSRNYKFAKWHFCQKTNQAKFEDSRATPGCILLTFTQ